MLKLQKRFWGKVDIKTVDECWPWMAGFRDEDKYGQFSINRKPHASHRIAYMFSFGEIPAGMCVCHHCDNPPCCNPNHLFLATPEENNKDRARKGRTYNGEQKGQFNNNAKLSEEQIVFIRNSRLSFDELALKFNISRFTVRNIIYRNTWKHII